MINIRKGVFETNSSSMHSVCISKNNNYELPSYIYFSLDEFGWENCIYRQSDELAAYLYTAIVDYYGYENRDKIEDYKNYIYETLGKYNIDCEFEDIVWRGDDYKFLDNGYIDQCIIGRMGCNYIDDYIDYNLLYEWECDGEYRHEHDFRDVISSIIIDVSLADTVKVEFNFAPYIYQYSDQEMEVIEKLLDKLLQDKQEMLHPISY